jgi:histone-lysine N-methyltransferase SETMAR
VQQGVQFDLELFDCECKFKGKGVRTREFIPKGAFVVEYMGEIIGSSQAENLFKQRSQLNESNYILVMKEHFSGNQVLVTCIDAKNYGNLGRFVNHSCEPNLIVLPVRINNVIPHAALFAIENIEALHELSYDYNAGLGEFANDFLLSTRNKCYCGSSACKGYLPASLF